MWNTAHPTPVGETTGPYSTMNFPGVEAAWPGNVTEFHDFSSYYQVAAPPPPPPPPPYNAFQGAHAWHHPVPRSWHPGASTHLPPPARPQSFPVVAPSNAPPPPTINDKHRRLQECRYRGDCAHVQKGEVCAACMGQTLFDLMKHMENDSDFAMA